jgi:type I restriction enzyme S subunit
MPRVDLKHLFSLEVDFPPLPEQKRIAAALDRRLALIAEAREAAERRLAAAELLESALFREAFGGVTPVSIGAGEGGGRRLSEVARLESGHTPSRKKPEWWGGDIPWIALPDIRALDGRIAMETIRNTNPEGIANSSARILPKDTVVFGRDVQVGFTTILGRPMATSQHFFNWICGDGLNPRYLMHALRASKPYLESMSSGAIHKTIYMPAARDFHLLLPPRETQDAIAADLDTRLAVAAAILQSARTALETIKALPAAALREVFG